MKTRIPLRSIIIPVLLLTEVMMIALSAFLFTRVDQIVHSDLYRYGLQFSYEWAEPYWTYAKSLLGLLGLAVASASISIVLLLASKPVQESRLVLSNPPLYARPKLNFTKLIPPMLFSVGVIALVTSVSYASSILALIGLGLVFWGAILFYIRPQSYVKETLLDKTTLPSLQTLDQIITELGYKGKGIYLPPKYFTGFESTKVYVSAKEDIELPSPEEIQKEENSVFLKNTNSMLFPPPGSELMKLFEKELNTNFTEVDLHYLTQNMPKLLIDLEIAQNVKVESTNDRVHVEIEDSIYKSICTEIKELSSTCSSLGCTLCSAIACALVKATGKPIIIEKDESSEDGHTMDIEYRLLEESKEKTH